MLKPLLKRLIRAAGYEVVNLKHGSANGWLPRDFSDRDAQILAQVRPFTMTSPARVFSMIRGVQYVVARKLPGAIVECGVYKGGSMMAAAMALVDAGVADRDLFLYDTFAGMTEPGEHDGAWERRMWDEHKADDHNKWAFGGSAEDVRRRLLDVAYPAQRLHLVQGDILTTVPDFSPDEIALLR